MSEYVKLWTHLEVWGKYDFVSYLIQHVSIFHEQWLIDNILWRIPLEVGSYLAVCYTVLVENIIP